MTPEEAGALAADEAIDALPVTLSSDLTEDEARALTEATASIAATLWESLRRLYLGRAWRALGYASWDDYCSAELRGRIALPREDRPAIVQSLRDAGLSTRAIASAVGADDRTVRRDLSGAANAAGAQDYAPASTPIIGRDGKSYAPPSPKPAVDPAAVAADLAERDPGYAERAERDAAYAAAEPVRDPALEWAESHDDDGSLARSKWNVAFSREVAKLAGFFAEWKTDDVAERCYHEHLEILLDAERLHREWFERLRQAHRKSTRLRAVK